MKWRTLAAVAVAVAALAVAATAADDAALHDAPALAGALCAKCRCEGATIVCRCAGDFQELEVTSASLGDASAVAKLEVRACRSVWLKTDAFRTARKLQTLYVENAQSATFEMGVFEELQSLVVHNVSSFNLKKSAFQGVKGLNNIVIKNTLIPLLPQWSLYDIKGLQEFTLENVEINVIEKDAIYIDMKQGGSKAEINKSKIQKIETQGLQVGNATNVIITNTEILQAEAKSIRISARQSMILKGNTFQTNVHAHAALILYNNSIEFSNNTLLNIDIQNISKLEEMDEHSPTYTLEILVSAHSGNKVLCKCLNEVTNTSGPFYQNLCVKGCNASTVKAFLQSCQKNKSLQDNDRFRDICKNEFVQTTPSSAGHHPLPSREEHPTNTVASAHRNGTKASGAQRTSVYFVPILIAYLFHLVL